MLCSRQDGFVIRKLVGDEHQQQLAMKSTHTHTRCASHIVRLWIGAAAANAYNSIGVLFIYTSRRAVFASGINDLSARASHKVRCLSSKCNAQRAHVDYDAPRYVISFMSVGGQNSTTQARNGHVPKAFIAPTIRQLGGLLDINDCSHSLFSIYN